MYTDEYSSYSEAGFSNDNKYMPAFPDFRDASLELTQYESSLVNC
jgi:hypothetical protein